MENESIKNIIDFKKGAPIVFIAVGMADREEDDVRNDITNAFEDIICMYPNSYAVHNYDCIAPDEHSMTYYLGEAIKKLGYCTHAYFVSGWENYKGCRIEHEVCKEYGITIIHE